MMPLVFTVQMVSFFILEILITCSKLRFCVGFGGGAGFLDSTVGIDQIAGTVQISRNQTQVGISLLTESVNVEGVILDAVISLSLLEPSVWKYQFWVSPRSSS